jgi:hypothetical protein
VQFTNDATLIAEHEYGAINKNTAHLWRLKMMRCLGALVSEAVLSGHVWIDEIYFDVPKNDKVSGPGWRLLRGISRNKVAVEAAIDEYGNTYAAVMGTGKPTSEMISEALAGHISPGSVIVHDKFHGHGDFIRESGARRYFRGITGAGLPGADAEGESVLRAHKARLRPACRDWACAYPGLSELGLHAPRG